MASSSTTNSVVTNVTDIINDTSSQVTDSSDEWMEATAPRVAFLAFFILFGFTGNLFLIITICHSHRFRAVVFYTFIINLAVVNLCECVFNMSILLASSIMNKWDFGDICCSLSVFFLCFVSTETVLGLTALTVDRLVAVRFRDKYDHVVSTPRITIILVFTWFQSFSFSIPIALGAIPTTVNNYTKSCHIAEDSSVVYGIFAAFLCFIVPLILMIVIFIKIIRTGYKERVLVRTLISQHTYKDGCEQEPRVKQELRHSNLSGTICGFWLFIQGPYVVIYYFNQLQDSSELETVTHDKIEYSWYIDLVLLWLRFSYVIVLPIAAFTWNKDLWKAFKDIILCRKNNSVIDESFKKNEHDSLRLEKKIRDEEKTREKVNDTFVPSPREQRVFQVPVLFATSHGVHIQTSSQSELFETERNEAQTGTLRGKKCDVIGSRENLNFEEDTSDYDSANEMDPFSVSNPISIRQLESEGLTDRQRSCSNPEVRESIKIDNKSPTDTVGSTTAGDSGLDLSSGTSLHTNCTTIIKDKSDKQDDGFVPEPIHGAFGTIQTSKNTSAENVDNIGDVNAMPKEVCENVCNNAGTDRTNTTHEGKQSEEVDTSAVEKTPVKKKKLLNNSCVLDSPIPRRKKKKRKDKNLDNISNASDLSCTTLPLRPPPRLAPIVSGGIKSFQGVRPGSGCSSQCSLAENIGDTTHSHVASFNNHELCNDCSKNDTASLDNLSISSFSMYRNLSTHQKLKNVGGAFDNQETGPVETVSKIKSVPEETYVTCDSIEGDAVTSGSNNRDYDCNKDISEESACEQTGVRNSEARRKRRDKLSANSFLGDGKGYKRLLPETP